MSIQRFFDYNSLPDNATRATLRKEATAIKLAVKRTHDNIIEIGNRLIHAKEIAGHGKFMEWIDAEFGMGQTMAWNFMNVAERFAKFSLSENLGLSQTALFMLAAPSVSDETRAVALELAATGDLKTTADAKAVIEASRPIVSGLPIAPKVSNPPPLEDDDDLGPDPFADEESGDSLADIAALDAEDGEPVADPTDQPESQYFDDEEAPAKPTHTVTVDTLTAHEKAREEAAQQEAGNLEELDDARWLLTLPTYRWLQTTGNRGLFFKRAALDYRLSEKALTTFQRALNNGQSLKMADNSPFSKVVSPLMSLKHPRFWRICGACKGGGCARCNSTGYDLAAGIEPQTLLDEAGEAV